MYLQAIIYFKYVYIIYSTQKINILQKYYNIPNNKNNNINIINIILNLALEIFYFLLFVPNW